ncbi:MAG: M3 family oligoendopeptidase [Nitrospira sp.]|nr:M3 family oligoendopeptidase [Nitrospira sp.]
MSKTLPSWNLQSLLHHPAKDFTRITKQLNALISTLEAERPHLSANISVPRFKKIWEQYETVTEHMTTLRAFSFLWYSENTKNQEARAFDTQVRNRLTDYSNRLVFLDLWWQSLDPTNAVRLTAKAERFRYHLETLTRFTPHTLSESEERILTIKSTTGRQALETLYGVTTNSFTFRLKVKARTTRLTREQLMGYVRHPLASVRRGAYQALFKVYGEHRDVLGEMYKNLVQDWGNEGLTLRHYASPIAVRNITNDVPETAVDALLKTCRKNAGIFQEYFRLKGRLLKIKQFQRYDLYAPFAMKKSKYSFARAEQLVMEAYQAFSPELAKRAKQVLQEHHLDAAIRPGKMGGAFCYSVLPTQTPYVLVNFTGESRDVSTLAHELGHAVHAMMAREHSIFTFHSSLPLAETASVFGEHLLSDLLLQQEKDPKVKAGLLVHQLDDAYATIMRQAYFVQFERQAHHMVQQGVTIDALAQTYLTLLREQFGPHLPVDETFQWEWLTIPHIFASPFYCYAYSFGSLLVLSLFQRYQAEGPSFVPRYLQLLSGGGTASPQDLLKPLQVDINSTAFWQAGFTRIQGLVKELERSLP